MTSTRLFSTFLLAVASVVSASKAVIGNDYPVILVHGLFGWGPDEMLGFKYWGGFQGDLEAQLKAQGFQVMTATVGPISSNWDRACELYAQIKGGQVDYGKNHAETHEHAQKGRTFKGLYPEWGTKDANGNTRKVHLLGHSMGGQTIRMLAQLLAHGSKGAPTPLEDPVVSGDLFQGGREDWIDSITTLSTPNQGTFLADEFSRIGNAMEKLVGGVVAAMGLPGNDTTIKYDAKMDHWGLAPKQPSETLTTYMQRVFTSKMFQPGFKDISLWSLSTQGAKEENAWVKTLPNIFYFAASNQDTFGARDVLLRNVHLPHVFTMLAPLDPIAVFLGSRYGPNNGFNETWQPNDGLVGVESMLGDGTGAVVKRGQAATRGMWYREPLWDRMDHGAVIGLTLHTKVLSWYRNHLLSLRGLGADSSAMVGPPQESDVLESSTEINSIEDLEALCSTADAANAAAYCRMMLEAAKNPASTSTSIVP